MSCLGWRQEAFTDRSPRKKRISLQKIYSSHLTPTPSGPSLYIRYYLWGSNGDCRSSPPAFSNIHDLLLQANLAPLVADLSIHAGHDAVLHVATGKYPDTVAINLWGLDAIKTKAMELRLLLVLLL
jgi:hypothetical protein